MNPFIKWLGILFVAPIVAFVVVIAVVVALGPSGSATVAAQDVAPTMSPHARQVEAYWGAVCDRGLNSSDQTCRQIKSAISFLQKRGVLDWSWERVAKGVRRPLGAQTTERTAGQATKRTTTAPRQIPQALLDLGDRAEERAYLGLRARQNGVSVLEQELYEIERDYEREVDRINREY